MFYLGEESMATRPEKKSLICGGARKMSGKKVYKKRRRVLIWKKTLVAPPARWLWGRAT